MKTKFLLQRDGKINNKIRKIYAKYKKLEKSGKK